MPLGFYWSQLAGPPVFFSGRTTANLAFEAPATKQPVTITLALRANDGALLSAPVTVDVVVSPAPPVASDDGGCGCKVVASPVGSSSRALWGAGLAGLALVLVRRRRARW